MIEMALTAAPEAVASHLGFLFETRTRKKRTTYRHISTLNNVIMHPSFPVAENKAALETMLDDASAGINSMAAAALLSIDPQHSKAHEVMSHRYPCCQSWQTRSQKRDRDAAWRFVSLASRGGWSLDWQSALNDEDPDVRGRAIKALPDFPKEFAQYAATIAEGLNSKDPVIAIAAAHALIAGNADQSSGRL